MIVFRLCNRKFRNDLSGAGAEKAGGRWNSKGKAVVYCGETRALCTTEIAVHTPMGNIPEDYFLLQIEIPDNMIGEITLKQLPEDWNHFPPKESTQKMGDTFIEKQQFLVLKVPSATVQGEHNFLINPLHPAFSKVKIVHNEAYTFDNRLFLKS
jgi:RES domain-containing protein